MTQRNPTLDSEGAELQQVLVNELVAMGAATSTQVQRATSLHREKGGLLSTRLVESGVGATSVLAVLASSSGLPPAPRTALQAPEAALRGRFKGDAWRKFRAAPFATKDGKLQIAFANPGALSLEAAARLPPHSAFVAIEEDVLRAQELLFGSASRELPIAGLEAFESNAATASPPPAQVGDYKVLRLLGSGGMASVYVAQELRSGREVALKVMLPHLAQDAGFVARFVQEAQSSASLEHENIVRVLSFGEEDGRYHIASELVDGGSLEALLEKVKALPAPVVAELAAQALQGAAYAHGRGVIHRDLKPGNLLVGSQGVLKLADFGIAKRVGGAALTQTGATMGTPAYMSPEQASGQPLDARSDLFSIGIILFELLSGTNPYLAGDAVASLGRLLYSAKPSILEAVPSVPEPLERVIDKLLERDPSRRFANATEALAALGPYLEVERKRQPRLLAEYLANPEQVGRELNARRREECLATCRRLLSGPEASPRRAALSLHRALSLGAAGGDTEQLQQAVRTSERVVFTEPTDGRLAELRRKLYESPEPADALKELAELYRSAGYLFGAFVSYKRYLHLRPSDARAASALAQLQEAAPSRPRAASTPSTPAVSAPPRPATVPARASSAKALLAMGGALVGSVALAALLVTLLRAAAAPAPAPAAKAKTAPAPAPAPSVQPTQPTPKIDVEAYQAQRKAEEEQRAAAERKRQEIREAYAKEQEREAKQRAAREEAEDSDEDIPAPRRGTGPAPRGMPSMPGIPRGF